MEKIRGSLDVCF